MLDDLIQERRKKLEALKAAGIDPYPARCKRTHRIAEVLKKFAVLARAKKKIAVAGRIWSIRDQGGVMFVDIMDETGQIQLVFKKDDFPKFHFWQSVLDRGDFIGAGGALFKTKKGEESVAVGELQILAKSIRPLPDKWAGLEDTETRLRQRYLDLLMDPEVKDLFRKKAVFWQSVRKGLQAEGFLEVWTPVLEDIPGGADAEPFTTHHNALNRDFYLRISLELPLKRLLVGGYEKVFEIGRLFRNEGIDKEHLQEYDDMEFYWAYADYRDGMKLAEKLFKQIVKNVHGRMETEYEGKKIRWGGTWDEVGYFDAFKKETGLDLNNAKLDDLRAAARTHGIEHDKIASEGRMIDAIYKKVVRPKLIQPCFLTGHPLAISPLSKRDSRNPKKVLRFQVVSCGTELGNGWSELNDPLDQRERFEKQMKLREAGDKEAQRLDEDYLAAMEYGMPPAVGFGMSERLFAVLMDKPIRETVIFPLMRKKST